MLSILPKRLINIGTSNSNFSQWGTIIFFPKNNKIAFYCSYCLYCFHCFLLFSLLLCIVAIVFFIVVHCKQYCVQYCLQCFQGKTSFPFKMATSYKKRAVRVTPVHVSEYARVACFGTQYSCFYF